jgi:hypothetical protein
MLHFNQKISVSKQLIQNPHTLTNINLHQNQHQKDNNLIVKSFFTKKNVIPKAMKHDHRHGFQTPYERNNLKKNDIIQWNRMCQVLDTV